ncbi:MAG: hypothetical protein ACYCX3_14140 [Thermoleophilia bacterium]
MESDFGEARIRASELVRAALDGAITADEVRSSWPLEEGRDPSLDALAHIYFDHFLSSAKRREPDEDDVAGVLEFVEILREGEAVPEDRLRSFNGPSCTTTGTQLLVGLLAVIAVVLYLVLR